MSAAGIIILALYTFSALAAPIVTPFSPQAGGPVSGILAPPVWFSYFSEGSRLSQNVALNQNERFAVDPLSAGQGWQFIPGDTSYAGNFEKSFNSTFSFFGSGSGSLQVVLDRTGLPKGNYSFTLEKTFTWPYHGRASRFEGTAALRTPTANASNPVRADVFLRREDPNTVFPLTGSKSWDLSVYPFTFDYPNWWRPNSIEINSATPLFTAIVSPNGVDPAVLIFSSLGQYTYGITVSFTSDGQTTPLRVNLDDLNFQLLGTSWGLLGTDYTGHDVFTQLLYGARISLLVGLLSAAIGIVVGLGIGLVAGYVGKIVDEVLMRFTDMLLVIPTLPLLIILIAVLQGHGTLPALILVIGFLGWMGFARVVRAQVLSLKERPFIEAAKAAGAGTGHIARRHIIPNIVGLVYVNLALAVPGAILSEAALSFLGLGDPSVLSWGRMLNLVEISGSDSAWWWVLPPGISIALVSLSFVMIGFSLDSIFNPRLRQRR